jgi:hypothetical protein
MLHENNIEYIELPFNRDLPYAILGRMGLSGWFPTKEVD